LGYLMATVEFALKREDLKEPFSKYLLSIVNEVLLGEKEAAFTDMK